jgi:hypothetical protein
MNIKSLCVVGAMLLGSSVAMAQEQPLVTSSVGIVQGQAPSEGRASSEISFSGITQFTRPSTGMANLGTTPTLQSSKISYGGSAEYRRWYGNNGFAVTYSVVASNAHFWTPSLWSQMSLTRHEGVVSYVRRFFPYSKLRPYVSIGAGAFLTHGRSGSWENGVWDPQGYLGLDAQFEMRAAVGFDLWHTRHFGIRTGYVVHWFRAPNFSDPSYRGARTFITEPQIGLLWAF